LIFLGLVAAMVTAAPQSLDAETTPKPHVTILKQINQLNDDGSYTYGFEADDGSFRVENRDIHGNVKGKYGFVDEFGQVKLVEYVAGSGSGFNPQGDNIAVPPPAVGSSNDGEFGTDEEWNSVDADEDGIPDLPGANKQRVVPAFAPRPGPVPVAAAPQPPQFQQQLFRIPPQFQQQQQPQLVRIPQQFQQPQFVGQLPPQQVRFAQLNPAQL